MTTVTATTHTPWLYDCGKALTGALLLGLTLAGLVIPTEARRAQPSPPSGLTEVEQFCHSLGAMALAQARARDTGVSYLALVQAIRQQSVGASVKESGLSILRFVYDTPRLSPEVIRQQTELACLDKFAPSGGNTARPARQD